VARPGQGPAEAQTIQQLRNLQARLRPLLLCFHSCAAAVLPQLRALNILACLPAHHNLPTHEQSPRSTHFDAQFQEHPSNQKPSPATAVKIARGNKTNEPSRLMSKMY